MALILLYLGVTFVVAFFLGSIPWGVIISRLAFHKDIRDEGSGNIGTTNAFRALGKAGGAAVFVLDFGKGLLAGYVGFICACLISVSLMSSIATAGDDMYSSWLNLVGVAYGLAFLGCVSGHIFSPWLKFKGGKGIAVAAACLWFVFGPVGFWLEIAIFALIVLITRYVSAGSIAAAVLCPFLALYYFWGQWLAFALITAGALLVIWAHRGNIERLRAGTERRIGDKK